MKNVPIKFRGRFWHKDGLVPAIPKYKDGNFVYGGYARLDFLTDIGEGDYIIDKYGEALLVYPKSVAQLVGYDADGKEVYEGDKIQDLATGNITHAKLCACDPYEIGITTAYFKKVGKNND